MLRTEIANNTDLGSRASAHIAKGELVPDSTMVDLMLSQMKSREMLDVGRSWLLDGFPRTRPQAETLEEALTTHSSGVNMVVELDVDEKVILERIEARWVHIPSGRVYNLDYSPPKVPYTDDVTGEPLSKRPDDTTEVFQRRIDQYKETIGPLKSFYAEHGVLKKVLGNTSDEIYPKLERLVKEHFG